MLSNGPIPNPQFAIRKLCYSACPPLPLGYDVNYAVQAIASQAIEVGYGSNSGWVAGSKDRLPEISGIISRRNADKNGVRL